MNDTDPEIENVAPEAVVDDTPMDEPVHEPMDEPLDAPVDEPVAEAMPEPAPTDLEITVEVHVASLDVPVSDVRNWLSGAVVALPDLTAQDGLPVELRNGNRVIAKGSLVRLDDSYGIMIDNVLLAPKSNPA